jgi:hypothetical protein
MTDFDADDPAGRQKLAAEALAAHRERASPYLTLEVDPADVGSDSADVRSDSADVGSDSADGEAGPTPWIQFADDENVLNLDCTDEERERLESLLDEFPAFKIRELHEPEEAEGTNVRIGALADAGRIGQFADRTFQDVYGLEEDYRLWVAEV